MFLFHFESQGIVFRIHIMLTGMKFPFQRYNIIDIIANGLKPVNDKSKHD